MIRTSLKRAILLTLLSSLPLAASEIYATFNVKAAKEATLSFTVGGSVKAIHADVSDTVKKGDLLAELDNSEQKAALDLAQSDFEYAKIQNEQSQSSYKRYKKIKKLIDAEKYEQIKFGAQMSAAGLKKAQSNVDLRQAQLEKTQIRAPFDGVITKRNKELGDAVSGAQLGAFFEIMDRSSVILRLSFDEKYANKVQVGDTFVYKVDGMDKEFEGTIAKIYPAVDSSTRKLKAEVITTSLTPGLFGHGYIKAD